MTIAEQPPDEDDADESEYSVAIELDPHTALRLWLLLDAAAAAGLPPFGFVVNRPADEREDLRDLRRLRQMLSRNELVRPLYEAQMAAAYNSLPDDPEC